MIENNKDSACSACFPHYRQTDLPDSHIFIHTFLEKHGGVANIVARNESVGIIHTRRMYGEPVYNAERPSVSSDKLQLSHNLVHVMLVSETANKKNTISDTC